MSRRLRAAALLLTAISMTPLITSCSDDHTFAHQYPKADVNVSLQKALHDHRIALPRNSRHVQYSANSELEGYPLFLTFESPCSDMKTFSTQNKLTYLPMEKIWGTPAAVAAQGRGWSHRKGDFGYHRKPGANAVEAYALVSPKGSVCHVWVDS